MSSLGKAALRTCAVALAAAGICGPSPARISPETFESLELHGLRLGMTPPEIERIIRSRTDVSEAGGELQPGYDCDTLYPAERRETRDPGNGLQTPSTYGFEDSAHQYYNVALRPTPAGAVATDISFQEHRKHKAWAGFLAEAEQRFGPADHVDAAYDGSMTAVWCEPSADKCDMDYGDHGRLLLDWIPRTDLDNKDTLIWRIDEGERREARRDEHYRTLGKRGARRAFASCRGRTGKYADDDAFEMHLAGLMNLRGAGPVIRSHEGVPAAAFQALGIDPASTFGPGICFNPVDVLVEFPECDRYTHVMLRWARPVGETWIVALKVGGGSLRRHYAVVRREPDGTYRKIWWGASLAPYAAWVRAGAAPMAPE